MAFFILKNVNMMHDFEKRNNLLLFKVFFNEIKINKDKR